MGRLYLCGFIENWGFDDLVAMNRVQSCCTKKENVYWNAHDNAEKNLPTVSRNLVIAIISRSKNHHAIVRIMPSFTSQGPPFTCPLHGQLSATLNARPSNSV